METYLQSLGHEVTEVRILRKDRHFGGKYVGNTISGYYTPDHYDKLISDITPYERDENTKCIWTTLQSADVAVLARAANRLQTDAKVTTADNNIKHFVVFPIDVDSTNPSETSASEPELNDTKQRAAAIYSVLTDLGLSVVKASSGNGCHLLIYIHPLDATPENIARFKTTGDIVKALWDTDEKNYNPARCWKLYGTTTRKGDNIPERPHRKSEIWLPDSIQRVSFDDVEKAILSIAPAETPIETESSRKTSRKRDGKRLPPLESREDLERLARECGAVPNSEWKEKKDYELCRTYCPLCQREDHGKLTYSPTGECGYGCHSNTCAGKNFQDLYESAGYSKVPENTHGGKREGAGRKSNAEKASSINLPDSIKGKPVIPLYEIEEFDGEKVISERSREVVSNDVVKLLWGKQLGTQKVYRRGTELGTLRKGSDTLQFTKLDADAIQGEVARVCTLVRERDGKPAAVANPPQWLGADILKNQSLDDVSEVKVVMSHAFWNGTEIISKPGYDTESKTYLDTDGVDYDMDTDTHSAESDLSIWKDLLHDFPFKEDADFENAMAYLITLLIRQGLKTGEATPLVDITAPREGVGKSLLAEVLTAAVVGTQPRTRALGSTKEEVEKGIGAALRGAPEVVLFDNVDSDKRLDSGILASVVTQPNRAFRILGVSEEMFYENRATIIYTGSNVEVTPELAKRMIAIRLYDTGVAEKDRKVRVEGLLEHTVSRHTELISSLLRMVKRWIDAGSVEAQENLHRMRQWSRVVHGVMLANGFGNHFLANFDDVMLDANPEFTAWANAFKAIVDALGVENATEGWTVADIFTILSHTDKVYAHEDDIADDQRSHTRMARGTNILGEYIGQSKNDKSRAIKLGKLLRSKVGNVFANWELIDTHKSDRTRSKIYALKWRGSDKDNPSQINVELHDNTPAETVENPNLHSETSNGQSETHKDRLLRVLDGKIILNLTAEGIEVETGIDAIEIAPLVAKLQQDGRLEKRIHNGEECFFATNSNAGSAEVSF